MFLNRAPALRAEGELLEPGDLPLALHAGRVIGRQATDQVGDPVAQVKREVRGGGAHQLAHVLERRLALVAVGSLELAHVGPRLPRAGILPAPPMATFAIRAPEITVRS